MRKINLLILLTIVLLGSTLVSAQARRTWVSGVGDDATPCSRTAPCKTFAGAISKTAVGGEIDALDPGGFGAVTITKAITIDGGGGQVASVLVAGTNAIIVQAQPNDVVTLRNLRINGNNGSGVNGIRWTQGKALHIESCVFFGFNIKGIDIAKADGGKAFILDTIVQDNTQNGIQSHNTTTTVSTYIDRSRFENNANFGVWSSDFSNATITNSDASGNSFGYVAQSSAGTSDMNLVSSSASNNTNNGVFSGGGTTASTVRISAISLFNNAAWGVLPFTNGTILTTGNSPTSIGRATTRSLT